MRRDTNPHNFISTPNEGLELPSPVPGEVGLRGTTTTHLGLLVGLDLFEREQFEFLALDLVFEFESAVVRLVMLRLRGRPRGWLTEG